MKSFLILISFIIFTSNIFAQIETNPNNCHQLGIHAGFTTGFGISYRYWPGILGLQLTITPIKIDESWTDIMDVKNFFFFNELEDNYKLTSLGLTALFKLHQGKKARFFSYIGNHYLITTENEYYNIGAGFGFAVESEVSFNIMIGYGAYDIINHLKILPTAELGIYQRF